jgi:DNA primase
MNCAEANQVDLVHLLSLVGHHPKKITGKDHWYLSPLRNENTASFKVNQQQNVWYDHGIGIGGSVVDFGKLYFNCSVSEVLDRLERYVNAPARPAKLLSRGEKKERPAQERIMITAVRAIHDPSLTSYLDKRGISLTIARQYCREIDFMLYGKERTVIGFQNDAGGYELRSAHFKGSSAPKTSSFFYNGKPQLTVMEGFFDYLSYQSIYQNAVDLDTNFLVLNSLSFLDRSRELMETHQQIHLYFDRDGAGIKATQKALQWSKKYIDQSHRYKKWKDLNEFLLNSKKIKHPKRQRLRKF